MSRESAPRPRDASFLGLHASYDEELQELDLYGTLREKTWSAELEWLLLVLRAARSALLAACPPTELPREPGLNPVLWSIGHVAFTFDSLVADSLRLQRDGELDARTARADAWTLYDSMRVSNAERWAMSEASALPDRDAVTRYLETVHQMAADVARDCACEGRVPPVQSYLILYAIIHELWHAEDLVHSRHMQALPPPAQPIGATAELVARDSDPVVQAPPSGARAPPPLPLELGDLSLSDDVAVPGGVFFLGAARGETPIVFDCEKWEHEVRLAPFRISRHCVTNLEFAAFVAAGGYEREELWSREGRRWLRCSGAKHPRNWRAGADGGAPAGGVSLDGVFPGAAPDAVSADGGDPGWLLRWFDSESPLPLRQPVSHLTWYEAEAYCNWAGRRLPTEAEWEAACCGTRGADGALEPHKTRRFPWGDEPPSERRANNALRRTGLLDVDQLPEGDSAWGARQMIGNVWEWTATTFYPWPGYVMDYPYREQSAPWFGVNKVARGGCYATPDLVVRGTYRSFYHPTDRKELAVGFRTCACDNVTTE